MSNGKVHRRCKVGDNRGLVTSVLGPLVRGCAARLALSGVASAQTTITSQQAGQIIKELLPRQAAALKLDLKQFDTCSKGNEDDAAITRDMTEGTGFAVKGTPTFFVGKTTTQGFEGVRIVGAQPLAVFQQRIESLLK